MSNRPEDFPSTPITKEAHSGLPGVPDDVAERVDNPNFEFDTPLIQQAKDLQTPEDLSYTAEVRGVKVPVVTPEEQETLAAQVAATHTPEKKRMGLKGRLALIGVGILGVAGIGTAGYNAAAEGPFMKAPTSTTPPVPGQGEKTPVPGQSEAPLPVVTPGGNETISYVPITEADVKDYNELVESSKITLAELKDGNNLLPSLVNNINDILNVHLTEEEIAASEHYLSPTGKVGPAALAEMKRNALSSSFKDKNSIFYKDFITQGEKNFKLWLETRNTENPYAAKFVKVTKPGAQYGEYAYMTNLKDDKEADIFRFAAVDSELRVLNGDPNPDHRVWMVSGQPKLIKTDQTTANVYE